MSDFYGFFGGSSGGGGGGSGTVTSVGLSVPAFLSVSGSPITTSGTLAVTLANEPANTVFAGPTSGAAAPPTFRALVGADLPNPSSSTLGGIQSYVAVSHQWINSISTSGVPSSTQPAFSDISGQASLTSQVSGILPLANGGTNAALTAANGAIPYSTASAIALLGAGTSGQVLTSGGIGAPTWSNASTGTVTSVALTVPAFLSISGSPITTSGTLAISLSGTALPVANGGTGATTLTAHGVLLGEGTSAIVATAVGSTGTVLHGNTGADPSFSAVSLTADVSGILPIANGGTNASSASSAFGNLSPLTTKGDILGFDTANNRVPVGSNAQVLTADSTQALGVKWATPTTGTVTSVALTVPAFLSVSGSPVTSSGTLAVTLANENANLVFAGPTSGGAAAPTFRALVVADQVIAAQAIAAAAIDWSTGFVFTESNGATNRTFTFSNQLSGQTIVVRLTQTTGTVTWPTVKWAGGSIPTATASGTDVWTFMFDGTSTYGSVVLNMS